nr:DEAD-box ATP-dependent RNA helicase 38 [Tanacetum cinerariifolium]
MILSRIPEATDQVKPHASILPIGSVKSTALVTAILYRVDPKLNHPQAICIVPNRESAIQIKDLLLRMGKHSPITCVLGLPPSKKDYTPLAKKLPVEAQVIIRTPVTIHKWIVAQKLVLNGVGMLLIPGFKDEVVRIMQAIGNSKRSPQCQ